MDIKKHPVKYIKFFVYLILVILINIAVTTFFFRIDLTKNKIYSLSNDSKAVVSTLSEPLTVKVFFSKNIPAPHNNTEQYLRDLLEEYSFNNKQYFNYIFYNVDAEEGSIGTNTEGNQKLAHGYGIYPVQIQSVEKDEIKFIKAYMGLVIIHGDLIEKMPVVTKTHDIEYKLTSRIKKMNNKISTLLSLPGKIKINLFLSSSLFDVKQMLGIDRLSDLPEQIKNAVASLNGKNYGKLEFSYIDPTKDEKFYENAKKFNLINLNWPNMKDKIRAGKGTIGLVMEYNDKVSVIELLNMYQIPLLGTKYELTDLSKIEDAINKNIESLININESIGYLSGYGTRPLFQSAPQMRQMQRSQLNNFRRLVSDNYSLENTDLKKDGIPESLNCLIIAHPTLNFTEFELFQIDQFLMRGNSLALFLDSFSEVKSMGMGQDYGAMQDYAPIDTNLKDMLSHYGISIGKSIILDKMCIKENVSGEMGGGQREIYTAPVVVNKHINSNPEYMRNIKELIVYKNSPLTIDMENALANNVNVTKLLETSEKSWLMSERINLNPAAIIPPAAEDEFKSHPLSYMLEGDFKSYFAGKSRPVKEVENPDKNKELEKNKDNDKEVSDDSDTLSQPKITSKEKFLEKSKAGKIFIMASSEVLTDILIDAEGQTTNSTFIMNIIDHLNNRDGTALLRSKIQTLNPLDEITSATKIILKAFNIAVLPVFVILCGIIVWAKRASRKKRIQLRFKKS